MPSLSLGTPPGRRLQVHEDGLVALGVDIGLLALGDGHLAELGAGGIGALDDVAGGHRTQGGAIDGGGLGFAVMLIGQDLPKLPLVLENQTVVEL